ncbi:MAG: hypothetical protein DRP85_05845 [Candidatus Makaraimicrobium thalassicum]|nr:MAG: hypothetical protein DRP85_05845 [Candidatus Omnitrophota bacterium]
MAKKVLLIEDSPLDAAIAKEFLEKEGLEVDVAMTGEEGLEKSRRMKPDLILVDLALPGIDGFEVCARLKKEARLRDTIVVVLSVKDDREEITRAFDAGADDYIIKIPRQEFLAKKIKLYLSGK